MEENISESSAQGVEESPVKDVMAYPKKLEKELILRDELAIERTKLAEERTSLAYIRTGMSLFLGGIFFIGYFEHGSPYAYVGYITVIAAILFTIYGFRQNKRSKKFIATVVEEVKGGPDQGL